MAPLLLDRTRRVCADCVSRVNLSAALVRRALQRTVSLPLPLTSIPRQLLALKPSRLFGSIPSIPLRSPPTTLSRLLGPVLVAQPLDRHPSRTLPRFFPDPHPSPNPPGRHVLVQTESPCAATHLRSSSGGERWGRRLGDEGPRVFRSATALGTSGDDGLGVIEGGGGPFFSSKHTGGNGLTSTG